MRKTLYRWVPALVAVANGIGIATSVYTHQGNYPTKMRQVQLFIALAGCLLAAQNRVILAVGLALTLLGILFSFSIWVLYLPTFAAVIWRLSKLEPKS